MPKWIGFDNEKYLAEQTAAINERVARFGDKLYLEFGGKLLFDYHAARVLPGFDPNVKLRLLQSLGGRRVSLDAEEALIALAVSATSNPAAEAAVSRLRELRGCEVHVTHMPTPGDEAGLRKLGVNLTSEPDFASKHLFVT